LRYNSTKQPERSITTTKSAFTRKTEHARKSHYTGGTFAIAWACTDDRLKAIAPYYASNPRPLEAVARLCPVVGSYPTGDFTTSHGQKLDTILDDYKIPHDIKFYPGARHSFFNDQGRSYNATAAQDSWQRVMEFFKEHIA